MNFSITKPLGNPDTILLGLYYANKQAAICGSYIDSYGDVTKGIIEWFGDGLASALHNALQEIKPIPALYLLVFCNHKPFVDSLTKPIKSMPNGEVEKIKYRYFEFSESKQKAVVRTSSVSIPKANLTQMELLRSLCHYRAWKIVYSDLLPVSQAYYESRIHARR